MLRPTRRQLQLLSFIESYFSAHGMPPRFRDMCAHLGVRSTNAINDHLKGLTRKGLIAHEADKHRTVRATNRGRELIGLPPLTVRTTRSTAEPPTGTVDPGWRCGRCGAHTFIQAFCFICTRMPELVPVEVSA